MKKLIITLAVLVAILMVNAQLTEAAIVLAPDAEGTSGKIFYPTTVTESASGTTVSFASSINGLPNSYTTTYFSSVIKTGPFIQAGRVINTTTYGLTAHSYMMGIIEFDISSLTGGPYSASLTLDFNNLYGFLGNPGTLKLFDMAEASEDGVVTTGETKGSWIADVFSYTSSSTPAPGIYTIDVSAALAADLANIGSNSYSGFILDYTTTAPTFPLNFDTEVFAVASFNNYQSSPSQGSTLTVTELTPAVPEPSTLILLGAGLVGLFFARRKRS